MLFESKAKSVCVVNVLTNSNDYKILGHSTHNVTQIVVNNNGGMGGGSITKYGHIVKQCNNFIHFKNAFTNEVTQHGLNWVSSIAPRCIVKVQRLLIRNKWEYNTFYITKNDNVFINATHAQNACKAYCEERTDDKLAENNLIQNNLIQHNYTIKR